VALSQVCNAVTNLVGAPDPFSISLIELAGNLISTIIRIKGIILNLTECNRFLFEVDHSNNPVVITDMNRKV
jgi:hypothetical protein